MKAASSPPSAQVKDTSTKSYPKDPYYIHPSDNPGLHLVSNPLTLTNYLMWKCSMEIVLTAKDKLCFVDGTCKMPEDPASELYTRWIHVNSMVVSWLINSMSKELAETYIYTKSARQLWVDLEEKFGESDRPHISNLKKKMATLFQGNDSLALYSNKLKKLMDELNCLEPRPKCTFGKCTCDILRRLDEIYNASDVMQLLMGLNETYDAIVSSILMLENLPAFNKAYSMVARVEKQRIVNVNNSGVVEASAMMVKTSDSKGNMNRNSFKKKDNTKKDDNRQCNHCGKQGHTEDTCFKKNGYPDWYREKYPKDKKPMVAYANATNDNVPLEFDSHSQDHDNNYIAEIFQRELQKFMKGKTVIHDEVLATANATFLTSDFAGILLIDISNTVWIVGSGASSHICSQEKLMSNLRSPTAKSVVYLPDGSEKLVSLIGGVHLTDSLILHDVLFIPGFSYNLISVARLCDNAHIQVLFHKSGCILQDLMSNRTLGVGRLKKNLYLLRAGDIKYFPDVYVSKEHDYVMAVVTSKVWQARMGHPSNATIKHLNFVPQFSEEDVCRTCHLAKQTRLVFHSSTSVTNATFELIHVDGWGPYKEPSLSGACFMLTIVDDFSRGVWTYLMQPKTQVANLLENSFNFVKNHFHTQVKVLRSDNGREFVNQTCSNLFTNLGIVHHRSCTHTPQQNGVVERKHRHLLQVTRALLTHARLPQKFWGEALLMATYLINRLPTANLHWKTPYSILNGTDLDYTNLRVFGCLCYATNVNPLKGKLDDRARECIFIAYVSGTKGYKLYELATKKVFLSRDVQFYEKKFPMQQNFTSDDQCLPLPIGEPTVSNLDLFGSSSISNPIHTPDTHTPSPQPSSSLSQIPELSRSPTHQTIPTETTTSKKYQTF